MLKWIKYLITFCCTLPILGCPYVETYRHEASAFVIDSVEYRPGVFYYDVWKKMARCNIIIRATNLSESTTELSFGKSSVKVSAYLMPVQSLRTYGDVEISLTNMFSIPGKTDTTFVFHLTDSASKFTGGLRFYLNGAGIDTFINYYRIKHKTGFFWQPKGEKNKEHFE